MSSLLNQVKDLVFKGDNTDLIAADQLKIEHSLRQCIPKFPGSWIFSLTISTQVRNLLSGPSEGTVASTHCTGPGILGLSEYVILSLVTITVLPLIYQIKGDFSKDSAILLSQISQLRFEELESITLARNVTHLNLLAQVLLEHQVDQRPLLVVPQIPLLSPI